jgi:hypothetical protein
VRQLAQGNPSLKQLIDVMRFVMRHVFDLKVHIEVCELRMFGLPVPVSGRQTFEAHT